MSDEKLRTAFGFFSVGDIAGVERLCGEILREAPGQGDALHLLGMARLMSGRADDAIGLIVRALEAKPDDVSILENLGLAYLVASDIGQAEVILRRALGAGSTHGLTYMRLGMALGSQGRLAEAVSMMQTAAAKLPADPDVQMNLGNALCQTGKLEEARACYEKVLVLQPQHADAYFNLGTLYRQMNRLGEAEQAYRRVLELAPGYADAHNNLGLVYAELGRGEEAIGCYRRAVELEPQLAQAHNNLGNALMLQGRREEAITCYEKALAANPGHADASINLGDLLRAQGRLDEAIAVYDAALVTNPVLAEACYQRGNALRDLRRYDAALASYDRALAIRPDYAEVLNNRGNVLQTLGRHAEAVADYDRAVSVKPDFAGALDNRGNSLRTLHRFDEAIASYERAIAIRPDFAKPFYNRGVLLHELMRYDEAIASYDKALALNPEHPRAFGLLHYARLQICDWADFETRRAKLSAQIKSDDFLVEPLVCVHSSESPAEQLACAQRCTADETGNVAVRLWNGERYAHTRIRVAYLSTDFREHPVANQIAELIERHDRSKFEVIGVSYCKDDGSAMRARLEAGFDRFVDAFGKSHIEVAQWLRDHEIDIAVDLSGHTTHGGGLHTLAHRPAPLQVNYLGFPGTLGAPFIDYILADQFVVPVADHVYYTEKVVCLPDCFMVNDSSRRIAERTPSRAEVGLPAQGFVFCCFNNSFKLEPRLFDIWMRLLRGVNGSVLWLRLSNSQTELNLRREAQARGVDPDRLIFAPSMRRMDDHLARHRLADLFLDTLPYNAHATACDALWSGVPVLTCAGGAFAGRVAGSLLHTMRMPELVADDLRQYEALALKLASDEKLLHDLREKLLRNRLTTPLFDTARFCRHIESAYREMWNIWQSGQQPRAIAVQRTDA